MNIAPETIVKLKNMAREIRLDALEIARLKGDKGVHFGGGFSCVEIMAVLYGEILRYDAKNPTWENRDRFLPSKAHCILSYYPALVQAGLLEKEEMFSYAKDANGSRLEGHQRVLDIGLEYSGGSLGMAISVGIGMAISAREKNNAFQVYVLMGDGELNEGSVWEAFMSAAQFKLDNLTVIIDRNHLCYDGNTEEVMGLGDLAGKMQSFGWNAVSCNGHDVAELFHAFSNRISGKPNVIIADTIKGKGVSFMENKREWHHAKLTAEQYELAKKEIMED